MRVEMLVAYDASNNKARNKLADQLKDLGLTPIQKSVMWGYLSRAEQSAVRRIFEEYLQANDRAFLIRVNLTSQLNNFVGMIPAGIREPQTYDVL